MGATIHLTKIKLKHLIPNDSRKDFMVLLHWVSKGQRPIPTEILDQVNPAIQAQGEFEGQRMLYLLKE